MKKFGIIILLTAIIIHGFSQKLSAEIQDVKKQGISDNNYENTKITVGNDLLSIEENDSTLNLKVGNRGLNILESLEGPKYKFEKYPENKVWDQEDSEDHHHTGKSNRFKGHWTGIEFGFNNYLTTDHNSVMPSDIYYMTLHSGNSNSFNINFAQQSFGFTRSFGFVTGLGINWNNYRFDNNNNIMKGGNGVIEELRPDAILEKSKLTTIYLTVPLIFELHVPSNDHHLNIAAGVIGALKLGSHSKMVFKDGNKAKSFGDFSLNLLRYGPTVRLGYKNFQIYSTYYSTPLFKPGKSPGGYELYPFEIGFALTFNG